MNSLGVRVILPSVVALQPFCSGMSGCRYNMLFHSVVVQGGLIHPLSFNRSQLSRIY